MGSLFNWIHNHHILGYGILGMFFLLVIGIWLGFSGKIGVYSSGKDIGRTILLWLAPIPLSLIVAACGWAQHTATSKFALVAVVGVELFVLGMILAETWRENPVVWQFGLAMLTKITLSFLFCVMAWFALVGGSNRKDRTPLENLVESSVARLKWLAAAGAIGFLMVRLIRKKSARRIAMDKAVEQGATMFGKHVQETVDKARKMAA
jgi:hypothetical protein